MLRGATRLLLIAGSAAVGAAGATALRADLMVSYGADRVLEARKAALPFESGPVAARVAKTEVGDEGYWLTAGGLDSGVLFDKRLAVGDQITISGREGGGRTIEVVEMKPVGGPIFKVADAAPVRLMQVTCRVVSAKGAQKPEFVRFFIEVEDGTKPAALPRAQGQVGRT